MTPNDFTELENTVEQYATKGSSERGWRLDATEVNAPSNRLIGYPFATADGVGLHLSYKKGGITVAADVDSNSKATWSEFFPSVTWTRLVHNQRHELMLDTAKKLKLNYTLYHPHFTCRSEMNLLDGLVSSFAVSTRLSAMSQLGLSATYDPSRSGLKDYTIVASRIGCAMVKGGDLLCRYNATRGAGIHARVPLRPDASAVVLAEKERFLVGVEGRSPCGSQMMMNVNLMDACAMLAFSRNVSDMWKVTMNYSLPLSAGFPPFSSSSSSSSFATAATAGVQPRFGIVFSSLNAP